MAQSAFYEILFNAADVNILGGIVLTIKKNAEALVFAVLEVNADKTKCTCLRLEIRMQDEVTV